MGNRCGWNAPLAVYDRDWGPHAVRRKRASFRYEQDARFLNFPLSSGALWFVLLCVAFNFVRFAIAPE